MDIIDYGVCRLAIAPVRKNPGDDGEQITQSLSEARSGDVAFFSNKEGKPAHAGILLEDDKIIHPYGRVRVDYINEEGILNSETKIYTHHLIGIRRVLGS